MNKEEVDILVNTENLELIETTGKLEIEVCHDDSCSDQEFLDEGFQAQVLTGERRWEFKLISIGNWPEFKYDTCYKRVAGVKIPYPCPKRRTCNKAFYAEVVLGGDLPGGFEGALKDCAKLAAAIAIPLVVAGQFAAAAAAFGESLKACLIAKGYEIASQLRVGVHSRKTCGSWRGI